ncbi:DegT/DnrJ/EryC1/StrS family aminotransferase [Paenibacillus vini]|uniref:GDP-perosamine synthase n=1 Tax=Paenibacillus vini TaxID=1476024 RepID=A0ABQ4MI20_9BACL|nr:DegT/DnrJ/EryC1/StrS family aminotransferase [Paenibacillus vini]GIP55060.1 GDP-perosamine synthase [Paenibacillus vini]
MNDKFYPIAAPILNGNEKKYVMDCLDTTWISSNGKYIQLFEEQFARYCQTKHAIAISNGTTALHAALLAHGVTQDCEVIIPSLTFIATANAVSYCGAKPVFIDCEADTWNINPALIEQKITPRTKGIIVVHLYGHPVDMQPVMELAEKYGLFVIEDAAEAMGAHYRGSKVGSLGHSATFSLFGNKIITTGEGGMVTTNDDSLAEKVRLLRGQGIDPNRKYWHTIVGYNYRMTNIQAAIGLAQLENIDWHVDRRRSVAAQYHQHLKDEERLVLPIEKEWAFNVFWMYSIVLKNGGEQKRDELMLTLRKKGIETRPFFYPMHVLPPYDDLQPPSEFPVSNEIAAQGINLPTHGGLSQEDIAYISSSISEAMDAIHQV